MKMLVPVLTRIHKPDILRHLRELSTDDLWLRFRRAMPRAALESYVNGIDFSTDRALGVYDAELNLIGFTHLAYSNAPPNSR